MAMDSDGGAEFGAAVVSDVADSAIVKYGGAEWRAER